MEKERSRMGVQFAAETKERHGPICKRLFNKKRKPFNSLKQRLQGTDILTVRESPNAKMLPVKKYNWRQQHEDFINTIRSAKQCMLAIKEGRPLPPPPPPTINPDYIQCPYCMRRFNETAATRHINFCKNQASRRVFDPAKTAAKIASKGQNKSQMIFKKESTVTNNVGTLLPNRIVDPSRDQTTETALEKRKKKKAGPLVVTLISRSSPEARTGLKVKKAMISKKN
ncbi:zinc finger C2HC domain-containing protein 1B isoform X5 [Antechinus flavipes]|uniref:zinc finger C2HC domain-containing protein 1B isoform X5 n=1 Tax=Antechinus flavipes TaxID=38775 RepID=UPI00223659B6|nr:zinc finger C2HC domain-containing protein 1B isoform X5 [Antechinus flavipes]XP_051853850.1 zinc finger C2HC domain-containing protein 1B isoform X5 [Antechinus flavipes]